GRRLPPNLTSKQALITFVDTLRIPLRNLMTKGPQQVTDFTSSSWAEALREFLLNMEATRAPKTHRYYKVQLAQLVRWADTNDVSFSDFGKRDLDRFLVERAKSGKSQVTLHHDAICAKAFLAWCSRNDLLKRSPLADYQVRNAAKPPMYMPTDEDVRALLAAIHGYWNTATNPDVRYNPSAKRIFHRDRNYAIILGLLDTACRIGEMISLKVDDIRLEQRSITIRESKGRESRTIPISAEWAATVEVWLKVRRRAMKNVPIGEDEGWLFISETGSRLDEGRFLKVLKKYRAFANLTGKITLHSLRRFSINKLVKHNLLMAQIIAGHKDTKTTLIYTKLDPEFVRDMHGQVGVVRGIVTTKAAEKRKRLV
ncbi:MAG: tyrosine-type recombinase/integrase, partial [Armatimonadota bacterium]